MSLLCLSVAASNMPFAKEDFKKAVRSLKQTPNNTNRCPDQYVGDVVWQPGGFVFSGQTFNRRDIGGTELPENRLIIVLESPHVEEYNSCHLCNDRSAIGPANGVTGRNIREHLARPTQEFALVSTGSAYGLILMNAVPYQCSLGNTLGEKEERATRDNVFRECWKTGARDDFTDRLSSYVNHKSLLVNACTKGETKGVSKRNWLRHLVEDAILASAPNVQRLRRCHPCSYHWTQGRSWS